MDVFHVSMRLRLRGISLVVWLQNFVFPLSYNFCLPVSWDAIYASLLDILPPNIAFTCQY